MTGRRAAIWLAAVACALLAVWWVTVHLDRVPWWLEPFLRPT